MVERRAGHDDRTPWWEEVKRCVEGEHVPNRFEGWNHPVAGAYLVFYLTLQTELDALCLIYSDLCSVYISGEPTAGSTRYAYTTT